MDERYYRRQIGLIDPTNLKFPILLAGVGTVGSWTAVALDKIGCSNVKYFDPDTVENANVGCQLYSSKDVGKLKIIALGEKIENPGTFSPYRIEEYKDTLPEFELIINAVDSMDTRKFLFESLQPHQTLIDGRMAGNAIEIYTSIGADEKSKEFYGKTLFSSKKARPIPCGMKAVAYNGFVIAGLITDLVAKYANKEVLPNEILVDLKNLNLFTTTLPK